MPLPKEIQFVIRKRGHVQLGVWGNELVQDAEINNEAVKIFV
jgi:hypothetical protein